MTWLLPAWLQNNFKYVLTQVPAQYRMSLNPTPAWQVMACTGGGGEDFQGVIVCESVY
nr:hypothetical protein [Legionella geestiana]